MELEDTRLAYEIGTFAAPVDSALSQMAAAKAKLLQVCPYVAILRGRGARCSLQAAPLGALCVQATLLAESEGGAAGDGRGRASSAVTATAAVAQEEDEVVSAAVSWHSPAMDALQAAGLPHGDATDVLAACVDDEVVARMAGAVLVCRGDTAGAAAAYEAAGLTADASRVVAISEAAARVRAPLELP